MVFRTPRFLNGSKATSIIYTTPRADKLFNFSAHCFGFGSRRVFPVLVRSISQPTSLKNPQNSSIRAVLIPKPFRPETYFR